MRYADNYCTYEEKYEPEHVYIYTGPCVVTKELQTVTIPAKELYQYRKGKSIQLAMPSLSRSDREFLISGMSTKAWGRTFGPAAQESN